MFILFHQKHPMAASQPGEWSRSLALAGSLVPFSTICQKKTLEALTFPLPPVAVLSVEVSERPNFFLKRQEP